MHDVPTGLDALPIIGAAALQTVMLVSELLVIPTVLLAVAWGVARLLGKA